MDNLLKVSIIQKNAKTSMAQNIKLSEECIKESKEKNGANIVLFPELWLCNYWKDPDFFIFYDKPTYENLGLVREKYLKLGIEETGEYINFFRKMAKKYSIGIVLSYLSKTNSSRNCTLVIGKNGEFLMKYYKVHTFDQSIESLSESGSEFKVCNFYGTKIGVMTCYDREFPESARILVLNGAEIILVPNASPMGQGRINQLSTRAIENMAGVAMANYPGEDVSGAALGRSCAFIPYVKDENTPVEVETLVTSGEEEGIFTASFEVNRIRNYRKMEVFGKKYRKIDAYKEILSKILHEEYNSQWPEEFEKIKKTLEFIINNPTVRIEHVGSTAIPGIISKPIIDVDIIAKDIQERQDIKTKLEQAGFICKGNFGIEGRDLFVSKFKKGLMDFHVYLCQEDEGPLNHIIFRDYLIKNKNEAKEYSVLKQNIAKKYILDIKNYTLAKSGFVERILYESENLGSESKEYRITSEKSEISIEQIKRILDQSFWAKGHSVEKITKYVENSVCFGVINKNNLLIGFARTITDLTTFYYVWDFIIDENYRGRGIGKKLLEYVVNYKKFKGLCGALCTSSKPFYEKLGFKSRDNVFMCRD